ncbi:MAG: outer membrane lipoprotein carrier protein LolA [Proteobacteria bacterium]|nr:outer membrane lipoprotein carrier protein LolA [Pseudomonadota bacterium]
MPSFDMAHRYALPVVFVAVVTVGVKSESIEQTDAGSLDDPTIPWIKHLRKCQQGVFSIKADFIQERLHRLEPTEKKMRGVVKVRRGGRVRLEYFKPERRLIVSDGKTLWAFDPSEKTAIKSKASKSLLLRLFAFFVDTDNEDAFHARHLGGALKPGAGSAAIELVPKTRDPIVASIVLTLEEPAPCVKRVLVVDNSGAVIRITLENIRTNPGLGRKLFTFIPPQGTKIVH